MEQEIRELPFLTTVGMVLTYKCPIACPHCVMESGPHRTEEMPLQQALQWVDQIRAYRDGHVLSLALTGGEPFLNVENLKRISDYARELAFVVTVVTNGYWASSGATALEVLSGLPGIRAISISADLYHEGVPFDYIRNAVFAAKELGRSYGLAVCVDKVDNPQHAKIIDECRRLVGEDNVQIAIAFPVGRAQEAGGMLDHLMSADPVVSACNVASAPFIFPDGKVMGCIGSAATLPPPHPLYLGNLNQRSLAEILDDAESNVILHTLRVWGPWMLVSWLKDRGLGDLAPRQYVQDSTCDVCYKLFSDARIRNALAMLAEDKEIREEVAYGRVHYFNETTMADLFGLS